ncbi:MAG: outer membrane protein assembly factor BamD [Candidatus Acidiferrales bacterium]
MKIRRILGAVIKGAMAGNFSYRRCFVILALGAFFSVEFCPAAKAQQPADGSPQTSQQDQGAPVTAPAPQGSPSSPPATQTPKPAPKKKSILPTKSKKKEPAAKPVVDASAEPDKVLYDRALNDLKAGRYTEGRLALQTLINTYPDSEWLAKAKLSVADSYYKEGGTSNTTQAISEYKDFITFFPFLDEAAYAQMQVGMAHYRMMEKADRDSTQAQAAEDEFQAFILKYPQSPLLPKAEQYLREVQEVLGDGEFKIARYYYVKTDYRAAAARLVEVTDRYPLYSETDEALWMLGNIYTRAKQSVKNEDDKNHWGDLAAKCYDRILQDYPLSKRAVDARARLISMGLPAPPADPDAYLRMKNEQLYREQHHQMAIIKTPMSMLKGNPDVSLAARNGTPQMNPPNDAISATDILKPGAKGPAFTISGTDAAATGTDQGTSDAAPVDATTVPAGAAAVAAPGNSVGFEIVAAPNDPNAAAAPATATEAPAPTAGSTLAPSSSVPMLTPTQPAATSSGASANPPAPREATPSSTATGAPVAAPGSSSSAPPATGTAPAGTSAQPAAQPKADQAKADKADPKEESSSKKKKGVKKLLPW